MKKLLPLIIGTFLLAGCTTQTTPERPKGISPQPIACTMEAKACPDGSYVGRSGPNCEFAACPTTTQIACTEEAKMCPDGSAVARTGPNCEFPECPSN